MFSVPQYFLNNNFIGKNFEKLLKIFSTIIIEHVDCIEMAISHNTNMCRRLVTFDNVLAFLWDSRHSKQVLILKESIQLMSF